MTFKLYNRVRKHFRVTNTDELSTRNDPGYHSLQNVNWALAYLCAKAQSLWTPGEVLCIDEDHVKSRSRKNAFKTREPDKPIREGWTVIKLGEAGENKGSFVLNDLVKCGKHTNTNTDKGKNYNVVNQVLDCMNILASGRLVVLDSEYVTKILFEDAKAVWNLRMIGTLRPNTVHLQELPVGSARGYSETVHCKSLNINFWNYSNSVEFLDNDLISSRDTWEQIETQSDPDKLITFAPHAAAI